MYFLDPDDEEDTSGSRYEDDVDTMFDLDDDRTDEDD